MLLSTLNHGVSSLRLPGSSPAGATIYPLYLVHGHLELIPIREFANQRNKIGVMLEVLVLMLALANLLHHEIEVELAPP